MLVQAMLAWLPNILNSNLLPVKANGEVLLRSVLSLATAGITLPLSFIMLASLAAYFLPASIASMMAVSSVPRKMLTMAGGASLAPRRWSLPALATVTL